MRNMGDCGMFPPLIFVVMSLFRVSHVSRWPPRDSAISTIYIGNFRAGRLRGHERMKRSDLRWGCGPPGATQGGGRTMGPTSRLMQLHLHFFFSLRGIPRKPDVAKIWGPFDIRKVPETP
jgi:hypothetical protein